jgi:hypothetical protein
MANTRSGNIWYVDTARASSADDLLGNVVVLGMLVTSSAASGQIVLMDAVTGAIKANVRIAAENGNSSGDSKFLDFSQFPLSFTNGIKVSISN